MNTSITVTEEHNGIRLDAFLAETHSEVSRARVQKFIKEGKIVVNDKLAKKSNTTVNTEDVVTINVDMSPIDPNAPIVPRADIPLDILHHDDDMIVVNKQSGLLMHADVPGQSQTLANALISHFPEIVGVGESVDRPGIMQRLDKDASGVVVIGRNTEAFLHLKDQFKNRTADKRYHVLVYGHPHEDEGEINFSIGRLKGSGKMAARAQPLEGDRDARSEYKVLEKFARSSLLEVKTYTGRTHQVRVHMKALGTPIVGDTLYGNPKITQLPLNRLFLHAVSVSVVHPGTGETVKFEAEFPTELKNILTHLRKKA